MIQNAQRHTVITTFETKMKSTRSLSNIQISEPTRGVHGIKAYQVEECICPEGYTGSSCEVSTTVFSSKFYVVLK